jgi:hypothetical protein
MSRRLALVIGGLILCVVPAESAKLPKVEVIGEGVILRTSPTTAPPWDKVTIANIFGFKKAPRTGATVTVVPAHGLPVVTLKVIGSQKRSELGRSFSAIDVAEVKDEAYLTAAPQPGRRPDSPDDVMVLYPAVKVAQAIAASAVSAGDLPPKVSPDLVKIAVDLNGDGQPDALVVELCCYSRAKPVGCDLICGEKYLRTGKAWKLIDKSQPM